MRGLRTRQSENTTYDLRVAPFDLDCREVEPARRRRDRHVSLDAPASHDDGGVPRLQARLAAADAAVVYRDGGIEDAQLAHTRVADLNLLAAVEGQAVVLALEHPIAFALAASVAVLRQGGGGARGRRRQTPLQKRLDHRAKALGSFEHQLVPGALDDR